MRRRDNLQRDVSKLIRRTDIRSDQLYEKVKDFVETSDEMADRICYTVRKVLSTTDDAADILYETMKKILGTDNTLRNRLAGLLELGDLSESELEYEIRKFLDAAAERGKESREHSDFPERMKREFRTARETLKYAVEDKADKVISRLEGILDSEGPIDQLKDQIRELIDSFKAKSETISEQAKDHVEAASGEFRDYLKTLTRSAGLSEEQLRQKVTDLLEAFNAGTSAEHAKLQNKRLAKALDGFLGAEGKLLGKYQKLESYDEPVNGALLLALVSFLGRRDKMRQEAHEPAPAKEFEREHKTHEQFMT